MKDLLATKWFVPLVLAALIVAGVFAYTTCTGPKATLTRKQEKATRAAVVTHQAAAALDTQRAQAADTSTVHFIRHASQLRQATHHLPVRRLPTAPAATGMLADSLTRVLTRY